MQCLKDEAVFALLGLAYALFIPEEETILNLYYLQYMSNQERPMRIINFSDARNSLRAVIDQVVEDADVTIISRRDAPDAVVMSFDYYSSLMETVHLLSSPANAAHLAKSIKQARSGQSKPKELIDVSDAGERDDAQHKLHG